MHDVASKSWQYPGYDFKNHLVISDSNGRMRNNGGSARETADAIIKGLVNWSKFDKTPPVRVVFYFNGGLNQEEHVIDQAANQIPCMLADGIFPVFFIWDTNGIRSYFEQAFYVRDGQLERERQNLTGAAYMLGDIIEGIGRAPSDYFVHGERYVNSVLRSRPCYDEILAGDTDSAHCAPEHRVGLIPTDGVPSPQANVVFDVDRVNAHYADPAEEIRYGALWPVRLVTTPFADGLGQATFTNYLRRTKTTIRKPIEFYLERNSDRSVVACPNNLSEDMLHYPEGTGAFAKIIRMLSMAHTEGVLPVGHWKCTDDGDLPQGEATPIPEIAEFKDLPLSVTMIGHSMGAIIVNELIYRFPDDLPYTDIVYMAAAAGADDTRDAIQPLLLDKKNIRVFNLVLHPLNDARERYAKGSVPSGSLLMWVDEMYQQAVTPDGKTFGYWPNAKASQIIFHNEIKDQILYRVFSRRPNGDPFCTGLDCLPANPTEHGGFNNDDMCFWRPAFWGATATAWREQYPDLPPWALRPCQSRRLDP